MTYHVEYAKEAVRALKKMDHPTAALIVGYIRKHLEGCTDPRLHGKGLSANRAGQWRYRVGDYRILAKIEDEKVLILILSVGHRRDVYEN